MDTSLGILYCICGFMSWIVIGLDDGLLSDKHKDIIKTN